MAEFFHLNQQDIENPANAEDKVINRDERIFADNVIFAHGDTYKVKTTSTAYRQKLKFFVDVIEYTDPATDQTFKYRCGYYYECEHYESVRLFSSLGFMSFYFVIDKITDGEFDFAFYISNENVKLYVSSVVFEDSFYNPEKGWLNPNNPDNIIDELEDDDDPDIPTIPGYSGGGGMTPYISFYSVISNTVAGRNIRDDNFCRMTLSHNSTSGLFSITFVAKDNFAPINESSGSFVANSWSGIGGANSSPATSYRSGAGYVDTDGNRGFSVTMSLQNGANTITTENCYYNWRGMDGYTYGIMFNMSINSPANGYTMNPIVLNAYYIGRIPTDKEPV